MKAFYGALIAALSSLGYPVYLVQAPVTSGQVPSPPYIVVWGPTIGVGSPDDRLDGRRLDVQERVGVTCVAGTPAGVLRLQEEVRDLLIPDGRPATLTVPGMLAWLWPVDARDVLIDTSVTYAGSSSHPAYGVALYQLSMTPT